MGDGLEWSFKALTNNWQVLTLSASPALVIYLGAMVLWFTSALFLPLLVPAGGDAGAASGAALGLMLALAGLLVTAGLLAAALVTIGLLTSASLLIADGTRPTVREAFSTIRWGKLIVMCLVLAVLSVAGTLAMCVGLYLVQAASTVMLAAALDRDVDHSATDVVQMVWGWITNGHWFVVLVGGFIAQTLAQLGSIACGIGVALTLPLASLYGAYVYRSLSGGTLRAPAEA